MAARVGRPPSDHPRTHVVPVRFSDDEHALLKEAAATETVKPGEFIRDAALAVARKTVRAAAKRSR